MEVEDEAMMLYIASKAATIQAGIAQLGEQQTEVRYKERSSGGPVFNPRFWHFLHV